MAKQTTNQNNNEKQKLKHNIDSFFSKSKDFFNKNIENAKDSVQKMKEGMSTLIDNVNNQLQDKREEQIKKNDEKKFLSKLGIKNEKSIKNIAVCATMSAGKTTFVNALLGSDVLPSRNEATTVKITSIYDKDGAISISGFAIANNDNIIEESDDVERKINNSISRIEDWNSNRLVKRIYLQGDLDNIVSKDFICAIHDTPGTNNSGDTSHHDITMNFLEENKMDTIIYISNCEHLCTDDEKELLTELYNRIILNQKISMIFILNKADSIDKEKEDPVKITSDYKSFLKSLGFVDFKIFPFSAKNARLLKMALKGRSSLFTETEKDDFFSIVKKFSKGTDLTGSIVNSSDSNFQIEVDGEQYDSIKLNMALKHTGLMEIEKEIEKILAKGK